MSFNFFASHLSNLADLSLVLPKNLRSRALQMRSARSPGHHIVSRRLACSCDRGRQRVGYPKTIRVGHRSEFVSRDLDIWAYQKGVVLDFSRPGKPTDNSFIESFNGKFRSECLNTHWFLSLDDARQKMEDWRRDYNEVRPHSAIGNKAPISLLNGSSAPPPA